MVRVLYLRVLSRPITQVKQRRFRQGGPSLSKESVFPVRSVTTDTTLCWNVPLDRKLINDVAAELNVDASFIEKDDYAVKVVQAIADYFHNEVTPMFCGGNFVRILSGNF